MPELSGSLAQIGLTPVVELLSTLGKTGDVLIACGGWIAQISLNQLSLVERDLSNPATAGDQNVASLAESAQQFHDRSETDLRERSREFGHRLTCRFRHLAHYTEVVP